MDRLLGFVCALLCAWNAEAFISGWTATAPGVGKITVDGFPPDGAATLQLSTSLAVGSTLFTVTANGSRAIASYTFNEVVGNPGKYGAIAVSTSGAVTLAKAIDYPTDKQMIFYVVASDGVMPTPVTGTIKMTVNFGPSTDSVYAFCVADPTPLGTVISPSISTVSTGSTTISGGDTTKFKVEVDGSIKTAAILESSDKVYYTATLKLTDVSTTFWPLHVIVDNGCLCNGVVHVISGVALIVITVVAFTVV